MRVSLKHWFYTILAWILFDAPALAQNNSTENASPPVPKAQYVVALLATLLILVIICKPSRKS